jgi:hypothetical protein
VTLPAPFESARPEVEHVLTGTNINGQRKWMGRPEPDIEDRDALEQVEELGNLRADAETDTLCVLLDVEWHAATSVLVAARQPRLAVAGCDPEAAPAGTDAQMRHVSGRERYCNWGNPGCCRGHHIGLLQAAASCG